MMKNTTRITAAFNTKGELLINPDDLLVALKIHSAQCIENPTAQKLVQAVVENVIARIKREAERHPPGDELRLDQFDD